MSESAEMSVNRKIAVGILSVLTLSFMGAGIYFLSKKTETEEKTENFAKGYTFLSVGIVLLISTIITVINPTFSYDPYLDQPFRRHHNHHLRYYNSYHRPYHRPYPYPYPRRPTPYPYPVVPLPLF